MNPKKQERRNSAVNMIGDVPVFWLISYHPEYSIDSDSSPVHRVSKSVGTNMNRLL
jgi:hypothetical protein